MYNIVFKKNDYDYFEAHIEDLIHQTQQEERERIIEIVDHYLKYQAVNKYPEDKDNIINKIKQQ